MLNFLKQVGDYAKETVQSARYIGQGMAVTFDHMRRRPITVQYPYEKLIPSERFRGRIHFEFDKCIACEVCTRVCPINLNVVDWEFNKQTKKKEREKDWKKPVTHSLGLYVRSLLQSFRY